MTPDWAGKPITYATFGDPQTLNLYSYVENSPVDRVDADGHCGSGGTAEETLCRAHHNAALGEINNYDELVEKNKQNLINAYASGQNLVIAKDLDDALRTYLNPPGDSQTGEDKQMHAAADAVISNHVEKALDDDIRNNVNAVINHSSIEQLQAFGFEVEHSGQSKFSKQVSDGGQKAAKWGLDKVGDMLGKKAKQYFGWAGDAAGVLIPGPRDEQIRGEVANTLCRATGCADQ